MVWHPQAEKIIQDFEARGSCRGKVGALIWSAVWAVESLLYLDGIDLTYEQSLRPGSNPPRDFIDVAHARWATSTAVTALDLCAAALGREYGLYTAPHERDLRDFDANIKDTHGTTKPHIQKRRETLERSNAAALTWIDEVLQDDRYRDVQEGARNPLTHAWLPRHVEMGAGLSRAAFLLTTGKTFAARTLVLCAKDLARDRVSAFLAVVDNM